MPEAQFDLVESYDVAPQSDWFHVCREAEKPFVVVRTGERTADVMWDYVTLPPHCDQILMANEQCLKEQAIAIFEKHASLASSVRAKATMVFFDNLSIAGAKQAANELYALIESLVENSASSTRSQHAQSPRRLSPSSPKPSRATVLPPSAEPSSLGSGCFELTALR